MENFIIKGNKIHYLDYLFVKNIKNVKNVPLIAREFILLIPIEITGEIPKNILPVSQKNFYFSISIMDYNFLDRKRWSKRNFLNKFKSKKEICNAIYIYLYPEDEVNNFEGCKILLDEKDNMSEQKCKDLLLDLYYSSNARITAHTYADLIDYLIQ